MKWHYGIMMVLSQKVYLALFTVVSAVFAAVYMFAWNLILLPDFFVRYDLWTPLSITFLTVISLLSGMVLTLTMHTLRMNMAFHKKGYGFLAIIPSFFTSICPGCAPLVLSFSSAAFGIGMALTKISLIIDIIIIIILSATLYFLSSTTGKCSIQRHRGK